MKDKRTDVEKKVAECYSTWDKSYFADYYGENAPYPPLQVDIVKRLLAESKARTLIDAGCGPASLMRYLVDEKIELYGFDLTESMVSEAKTVMAEFGVNQSRLWLGSVTSKDDFFQPNGPQHYGAALCFGVFPHIPEESDTTVLMNLYNSIEPDGIAIIEARNSLFSLFTLNRYSYDFILKDLIQADKLLLKSGRDAPVIENALLSLKGQFHMDLPPLRTGESGRPGYDEVLSRTHNPLVLSATMMKLGFRNVKTLFYHFHALPPMLSKGVESFFTRASVEMERPEDWRGYFMASAFILVGVR